MGLGQVRELTPLNFEEHLVKDAVFGTDLSHACCSRIVCVNFTISTGSRAPLAKDPGLELKVELADEGNPFHLHKQQAAHCFIQNSETATPQSRRGRA